MKSSFFNIIQFVVSIHASGAARSAGVPAGRRRGQRGLPPALRLRASRAARAAAGRGLLPRGHERRRLGDVLRAARDARRAPRRDARRRLSSKVRYRTLL